MWLRTTINYQYKYGTDTVEALQTLYKEGGITRFYSGLPIAIIQVNTPYVPNRKPCESPYISSLYNAQGPLSRFGDTAANSLSMNLWAAIDSSSQFPIAFKTVFASLVAGSWRIALCPIDTAKTLLQVIVKVFYKTDK